MKKFIYIDDKEDGEILINIDNIVYMECKTGAVHLCEGTTFVLPDQMAKRLIEELERR